MIVPIVLLQAALSSVAGVGLFFLWRRVTASSRAVYWLVTGGFLIRAVGGVLAFWISFLHLPVAQSLQFGNGLWIFADDARNYFHDAATAAVGGPAAIVFLSKTYPSVFFLQALATAFLLFGSVNSTGILLNLAAYLATCAVVLRFGDPQRHKAALFAIGAISFSPSLIVWSLQPLKDVFFLLLVAVIVAAAHRWQQLWETLAARRRAAWAALWTAAMAAVLYGISGIRYYFGLMIVVAAIPFAVLTITRSRSRLSAAISAALLLPFLMIACLTGAGPYIPVQIRQAVTGWGLESKKALPTFMLTAIDLDRKNFDNAGGATIIGAGRAISRIDRTLGREEQQTLAFRPEERLAQARAVRPEPAGGKTVSKPGAKTPDEVQRGDSTPARTSTAQTQRPEAQAVSRAAAANQTTPKESVTDKKPATSPSAIGRERDKVASQISLESPRHAAAATPKTVSRSDALMRVPPPAAPSVALPRVPVDSRLSTPVSIPASRLARVAAGSAALVLPRSIAQRLGILDVRGGRGLWLFVEIDTIAFDTVLVFAIVSLIGAIRRRALGEPVFWLCLLVTVMLAGALAYTVSNFGTLFRHRDMILLGLLLLSLAAPASAGAEKEPASSLAADGPEPVQA